MYRDLALGLLIAIAYCLAALIGLRLAVLPGAGTPVWPAAGIAFAGLVLGGLRLWPSIVVGRVTAAIIVNSPVPIWSDILVGIATMLGAYLPVLFLEHRGALSRRLGSMRDILGLTFGGGVLGALVSASFGVLALWVGGIDYNRLSYAWFNWACGFFVGVLTVAPLILSWSAPQAFHMKLGSWAHLGVCLGSVALLSAATFLAPTSLDVREWYLLPLLIWAALSFRMKGISAALVIVSVFAILGAIRGSGPLGVGDDMVARVLLVQQFIATLGLTMLCLAAIADERHDFEAKGRLAAIVSSSPEAIISFDRNATAISWNHGAEDLLGWKASEVIGTSLRHVLPASEVSHALERVLVGESLRGEKVFQNRSGTTLHVLITVAPVYNAEGGIIGGASVMRDITSLKSAEAKLQQVNETLERRVAERTEDLAKVNAHLLQEVTARAEAEGLLRQSQKMEAVGQLTGGIAHDFNNMLSVIIGSLDIVRRRITGSDPKIEKLLDGAMDGAERAARLTARLLAFSRRQILSPEVTDVNSLISGILELLRRSLGEKHTIETVLSSELWSSYIDPAQFENAVLNLAVNARDAMPNGGLLSITTANVRISDNDEHEERGIPSGDYVLAEVVDTGIGMSHEVRERAFDPFYTTKETGKGTGLGLSMVYGFVTQSGGHVRIQSEPGKGTLVRLYLPRAQVSATTQNDSGKDARGKLWSMPKEMVLVVEDQDEVRELSVVMLGELGFEVVETSSPMSALDLLKQKPEIRILFTDVIMPEMNGGELAKQARVLRPDLKILFTTGYANTAVLDGAIAEHGGAIISKPFTIEQVATKLSEVLSG